MNPTPITQRLEKTVDMYVATGAMLALDALYLSSADKQEFDLFLLDQPQIPAEAILMKLQMRFPQYNNMVIDIKETEYPDSFFTISGDQRENKERVMVIKGVSQRFVDGGLMTGDLGKVVAQGFNAELQKQGGGGLTCDCDVCQKLDGRTGLSNEDREDLLKRTVEVIKFFFDKQTAETYEAAIRNDWTLNHENNERKEVAADLLALERKAEVSEDVKGLPKIPRLRMKFNGKEFEVNIQYNGLFGDVADGSVGQAPTIQDALRQVIAQIDWVENKFKEEQLTQHLKAQSFSFNVNERKVVKAILQFAGTDTRGWGGQEIKNWARQYILDTRPGKLEVE